MKPVFINPETGIYNEKAAPSASYIRGKFQVKKPLISAELWATALGVYIPYLNGRTVTERQLLPGYTDYGHRVQAQRFDVTDRLLQGDNCIGFVLGEGWYRGSCGPMGRKATYGSTIAVAAELLLTYDDGSKETITTAPQWKATQEGPLRENDLRMIERYDATKEFPGWSMADFDDSTWHVCAAYTYAGSVVDDEGEPVLRHECFVPDVLHTPDGGTVLDFHQNMAGRVAFTVTGKAGDLVTLVCGETLSKEGNFTLANLQGSDSEKPMMALGQKLEYILKDGVQSYEMQFLLCGFRYVKVMGWPGEVKAEDFKAYAIYSDLASTGTFECSDETVNRFVQNVVWSMKSNFVDIPTDCPQRERAGWTGDINVFIETANYFADTRRFMKKWMRDFALSQNNDGALPFIIPPVKMIGMGGDYGSSAGWSDAINLIPMVQYQFYGDVDELRTCYEAGKRFADFNLRRLEKSSLRNRFKRDGYSPWILDTGYHFGEWLEPGAKNLVDALRAMIAPDDEVATAWLWYALQAQIKAAEILGYAEDAERYADAALHIREAYLERFIRHGMKEPNRQCKYVRPIYMGLVEGKERDQLAEKLNKLIIANDYKIGTGFLSTYQILEALSMTGYTDTAYKMLLNRKCPGWLYEVDKGATTCWEGWDAITEDGKLNAKSHNHYGPGAMAAWLFKYCAGIKPLAPGFQQIELSPLPGGGLTYARAFFNSVNGRIESSWRITGDTFVLDAIIPSGVKARIVLPDGTVEENAVSGAYTCKIG